MKKNSYYKTKNKQISISTGKKKKKKSQMSSQKYAHYIVKSKVHPFNSTAANKQKKKHEER